ncbi:protein WVD2-like 4 [Telopea speciosissima]|uniref:protein WVD2-like 4 n=1 Tax=Telopea speciosissima TaxID=54955 RepID=UPI001CC7C5EF|nr:protein WVD2-like 4 [Telopea speciosissima]
MESENGVVLEHANDVMDITPVVESSALNVNKENENADNVADVSQMNGISENLSEVDAVDSSGAEAQAAMAVAGSKGSNPSKKAGSGRNDGLKKNKISKDQASLKAPITVSRTQRPRLSQSLSFPARGILANGSKKITDGKPVKTNAKHTEANGTVSGPSSRRTTLASVPSIRQSLVGKSSLVNKSLNDPPSKDSQSHDQNKKVAAKALSVKDDEDTRSSSSTPRSQRRISGSGFNFRLDERAEKRKEFFSKLEEKTHVKEVERTNLQAKTKESQEAEIKQLRKSLTFKAAPMPNFYKEPPPKIELKKIPTTRPISPKLGRHKSSSTAAENSLEVGGTCRSPRPSLDHNKLAKGEQENHSGDSVASKKPLRKSLSKLSSQKSMKSTEKPLKLKAKTTDVGNVNHNEETQENQDKSLDCVDSEARTEVECDKNPTEKDETINLPEPEITSEEVGVKG